MVRKIVGSLLGLIFLGFGVALIGGWLDPSELSSEGGSGRTRALKNFILWLTDTLGVNGGGAALAVIGLVLIAFAWTAKGKDKAKGKPK